MMLAPLTFLFNLVFNLFQSKRELPIRIALQQKEIEILNRKRGNKRALIRHTDRVLLVVLDSKKIQGELQKLGISLDKNTIRNIIDYYRRLGKIKKSLGWEQFLSVQAHAMYAMDFFTVDNIA
jgi:hypothetical protein